MQAKREFFWPRIGAWCIHLKREAVNRGRFFEIGGRLLKKRFVSWIRTAPAPAILLDRRCMIHMRVVKDKKTEEKFLRLYFEDSGRVIQENNLIPLECIKSIEKTVSLVLC